MKMSPDQWWKAGGFSGIVFVVMFIIGIVLQFDMPKADAPGAEIKQYFVDDGTKYMIADFIVGLGFVFFFLPFLWALSAYLGSGEPVGQTWSRLILVYGSILTAVGATITAFGGALAYQTAEFADDNLLRAFVQAYYYTNTFVTTLLLAGLAFSVGMLIMRHGSMPKWVGWLSMVLTVIAVISAFAVFGDDPEGPLGALNVLALLLWFVWTLAISYTMLKAEAPPVPAASA